MNSGRPRRLFFSKFHFASRLQREAFLEADTFWSAPALWRLFHRVTHPCRFAPGNADRSDFAPLSTIARCDSPPPIITLATRSCRPANRDERLRGFQSRSRTTCGGSPDARNHAIDFAIPIGHRHTYGLSQASRERAVRNSIRASLLRETARHLLILWATTTSPLRRESVVSW